MPRREGNNFTRGKVRRRHQREVNNPEPTTAMATIIVSSTTVPNTQPTTATLASFSLFAEKNFWYIDWLPIISRKVGKKYSRARINASLLIANPVARPVPILQTG